MKADHGGFLGQHHGLQRRIAHGGLIDAAQHGRGLRAEAGKFRRQILEPLRFAPGIGCSGLVAEQIDVERAIRQRQGLLNMLACLIHAVSTYAYRPQSTRVADGGSQLRR